jgi:isopentenyl-diphosphate delta-isomerase
LGANSEIHDRKADHVAIVLEGGGRSGAISTGFERVRFEHTALPEIRLADIALETQFLGRHLSAPFLISSMTGGHAAGAAINRHCAEAAEACGIAFAVGSQRIALERGAQDGLDRSLRLAAPNVPIYANLGAAQFVSGYGLAEAQRAVDMVGADALIIHLNPLQEAVQRGGDGDWRGVADAIGRLSASLKVPVIVKEVGFGLSGDVVRRLVQSGVAAIDIAGAGGTNWALVEGRRGTVNREGAIAQAFAGWGIPTVDALRSARLAAPVLPLIGSGGIRDGVDAAKALRLGADLTGMAAGLLQAATVSTEAVVNLIEVHVTQLRIACFCTGSRDLARLKIAKLQSEPSVV